jgi:nucleotide-binding universal stress UspA family protein
VNWPPNNLVVVPVDFSEMSKEALDAALEITRDPGKVRVIHVLGELSPVEPAMLPEPVDDARRSRHAKQLLAEWMEGDKYRGVGFDVVIGDPGHEIAHYADELGADLIVMPSHGRRGIARMLIGSVAERTLRLAHCPVLVLRKPKEP